VRCRYGRPPRCCGRGIGLGRRSFCARRSGSARHPRENGPGRARRALRTPTRPRSAACPEPSGSRPGRPTTTRARPDDSPGHRCRRCRLQVCARRPAAPAATTESAPRKVSYEYAAASARTTRTPSPPTNRRPIANGPQAAPHFSRSMAAWKLSRDGRTKSHTAGTPTSAAPWTRSRARRSSSPGRSGPAKRRWRKRKRKCTATRAWSRSGKFLSMPGA